MFQRRVSTRRRSTSLPSTPRTKNGTPTKPRSARRFIISRLLPPTVPSSFFPRSYHPPPPPPPEPPPLDPPPLLPLGELDMVLAAVLLKALMWLVKLPVLKLL
jgi:hypothetical protein